jgi:hypothetical protein
MRIRDYASAQTFLQGGRNPHHRAIPGIRSTEVVRISPSCIAIRYHATNVVLYYANGMIRIHSGGFRTRTTKERINEYSPVSVFQRSFAWFVVVGGQWDSPIPFVDGMEVVKGIRKPHEFTQNVDLLCDL